MDVQKQNIIEYLIKICNYVIMETGEYIGKDNGIKYLYTIGLGRNGHFQRNDDTECYIKFEINKSTTPNSIFIREWKCFTADPVGSGRIMMKDLFEFMKEKYIGNIHDDTVVTLIPTPDDIENTRIMPQKRTMENLTTYYKDIGFDQVDSTRLSGMIKNIIRGIINYRKVGGKRKRRRKTKMTNKVKKRKKTRKSKRKPRYSD